MAGAGGSAVAGSDRRFRTRSLAALYGSGALLGLVALAVPHGSVAEVPWAVNCSLGIPVAVGLFLAAERVPTWLLHVLLVTGAGMVALGIDFGGGGPAGVATSFFFVWVALYVAWFFSPRVALAHVCVDGLLFAGMLAVAEVEAGPAVWVLVMGTAAVIAGVVGLMRGELLRMATRDPLTGLPSRHGLIDALARESARAERSGTALCVAVLDVDHLKAVNDSLGHQAGDALLADAARSWRAALRESDLLVRFGGDEFVAVLPDCPPEVAHEVIGRARSSAATPCSVGMAWWQPGCTPEDLLAEADADLYRAKGARADPPAIAPALLP